MEPRKAPTSRGNLVPPGFLITCHSIFAGTHQAPRIVEELCVATSPSSPTTEAAPGGRGGGRKRGGGDNQGFNPEVPSSCAICLDLPDDPITLVCHGLHSFCRDCVFSWFAQTIACPLCKQGSQNQLLLYVAPGAGSSCPGELKVFQVSEAEAEMSEGKGTVDSLQVRIRAALQAHRAKFTATGSRPTSPQRDKKRKERTTGHLSTL